MLRLPLLILAFLAPLAGYVCLWVATASTRGLIRGLMRDAGHEKLVPHEVLASTKDAIIFLETGMDLQAIGLGIGALSFVGAVFSDHLSREKKTPNQSPEPMRTAVTPPADAGDRASGAHGSS